MTVDSSWGHYILVLCVPFPGWFLMWYFLAFPCIHLSIFISVVFIWFCSHVLFIMIMVAYKITLSHDYSLQQWMGERCCHLSWRTQSRTPFNSSIGYVHRNEAHFTYILLWGSTHESADCWSAYNAHRPSAASDSFKRVHHWCMVALKPKFWLRRCLICHQLHSL